MAMLWAGRKCEESLATRRTQGRSSWFVIVVCACEQVIAPTDGGEVPANQMAVAAADRGSFAAGNVFPPASDRGVAIGSIILAPTADRSIPWNLIIVDYRLRTASGRHKQSH